MNHYIKVEFIKIKRTNILKLVWLIPAICFILGVGFNGLSGNMDLASITALNHWGLIWLPMGTVLFAGLVHKQEMKSTGYKQIYGLPLDLSKVWTAKSIVIASLLLIASGVLGSLICLLDLIISGSQFSLNTSLHYLAALLINWLAILWKIPFYLYLSQKVNYSSLIILSLILGLNGADMATKSYWWTIPWAWILRFQAPILGIHPNGIPLTDIPANILENIPADISEQLLSYSGFSLAISLAIILFIIVISLTTRAFTTRKDAA